jgi:hypothetical protein
MSIRTIACMMACVTAFSGFSASAATVIPSAGSVFVSQGLGFQKINGTTSIKVGDAVMVSPDGLAQVRLDDGNVITVSPGQVLNVPAKARAKDAALPNGAQATADLPIASPAATEAAPACAEPCINPVPAFLLLGAGIGAAIAFTNEHGATAQLPASP